MSANFDPFSSYFHGPRNSMAFRANGRRAVIWFEILVNLLNFF